MGRPMGSTMGSIMGSTMGMIAMGAPATVVAAAAAAAAAVYVIGGRPSAYSTFSGAGRIPDSGAVRKFHVFGRLPGFARLSRREGETKPSCDCGAPNLTGNSG
jgi:hypothetical protein